MKIEEVKPLEDEVNELIEKANKYLITSMVKKIEPVVVAEAKEAIIRDIAGKEYIDCFAGISVVNAGHCQPKIVNAAIEQAKKLIHACAYVYYIPPVIELAKKLAEITPPSLQKTFFGNSGAEAIECAIKLARKYTKKYEIISLMCSFHGRSIGTLSVTGQAGRRKYDMGPYLSSVSFAPPPYCYRCFFEKEYPNCDVLCARSVRNVIDYSTSKGIAAFIAEPIMGEGGIIVPPPDYFKIVKEILDENNILFIADEVQTGFGRTGKLFAIEHYGIEPDMITMAKGIANGFPISACITKPEIGNSFEPGDHLSTFGGNPVSAAAALANIEFMLEERLPEKAVEKGKYIIKRLNEMREKYKIIGDIRGKGLMIGIELVKNRGKKTPALEETGKIRDLCRKKGLLIGSGGVKGCTLRIQPPLVIKKEQIDKALNILEESIKEASN
ncbi:aspartate aminotransferase family protein [Candidatus Bathyarchaeota archaeon]|nr:aspartate aminotransferase family protein [Candidatus Bathyarchaeota archaeon]